MRAAIWFQTNMPWQACRRVVLLALAALTVPLQAQAPDVASDSRTLVPPTSPFGAEYKAAYDQTQWAWLHEDAGVPSEVVALLQAEDSPFSGRDVGAVKEAMYIDALSLETSGSGVTADDLLGSVEYRLVTKLLTDATALWYPATPKLADTTRLAPEQEEELWQQLDEYRALREVPGLKAADVLWASIAVAHDQRAVEIFHLDAYEYLMYMADYRVIRKVMVDKVVDAILEGCVDPNADRCQATYESGVLAGEVARAACRLNSSRSRIACDALSGL